MVWDAILAGLDTAGHTVAVDRDGTFITVGTELLQLMLRERKTKVHNDPSTREELKKKLGRYAYVPEWGFKPTGLLAFLIENEYLDARTSWDDGERKKLEDMVPSIVAGISTAGEAKRARRIEHERADLERREREYQEMLARQRREEEQRKVDELIGQARAWRQAQMIRDFVAAARVVAAQTSGARSPDSGFETWAAWAESSAIRMDPLGSR